jgi:hypothetical protein
VTLAQAAATALGPLAGPAPLTRRLARAPTRPDDSAPRWHFPRPWLLQCRRERIPYAAHQGVTVFRLGFRSAPQSSLRAVNGKSNTDSRPAATSAAYVAGRIRSSWTPIWPATTRKLSDVACSSAAAAVWCRSRAACRPAPAGRGRRAARRGRSAPARSSRRLRRARPGRTSRPSRRRRRGRRRRSRPVGFANSSAARWGVGVVRFAALVVV